MAARRGCCGDPGRSVGGWGHRNAGRRGDVLAPSAPGLEGRGQRFLPTSAAWAGLAGLLALAVACYGTAYEPVLHCQAELQLAEHQPDSGGSTS